MAFNGRMGHRSRTCGGLPRGPITLLHPGDLPSDAYILSSIKGLSLLPVCHAADAAEFLQIRGDILRGMLGESLGRHGLERVFGSDAIASLSVSPVSPAGLQHNDSKNRHLGDATGLVLHLLLACVRVRCESRCEMNRCMISVASGFSWPTSY